MRVATQAPSSFVSILPPAGELKAFSFVLAPQARHPHNILLTHARRRSTDAQGGQLEISITLSTRGPPEKVRTRLPADKAYHIAVDAARHGRRARVAVWVRGQEARRLP